MHTRRCMLLAVALVGLACLLLAAASTSQALTAKQKVGKSLFFEPTMWCHWLDRADYDAVADLTDYSEGDPPPEWA